VEVEVASAMMFVGNSNRRIPNEVLFGGGKCSRATLAYLCSLLVIVGLLINSKT
jgi:hypothetical protein